MSYWAALQKIISLDAELWRIIALTLAVTLSSTGISLCLGMPLGMLLGTHTFRGRQTLLRLVFTFMATPPVLAGLVVFLLLSRSGPLGSLSLLYTPYVMVIAQAFLVTPIIIGLTASGVAPLSRTVMDTCQTVGVTGLLRYRLLARETGGALFSAALTGYSRALSEVGAVMLVGGNILGHTRVITTAIVLETGKGNYEISLALGTVLLIVSMCVNWLTQAFNPKI